MDDKEIIQLTVGNVTLIEPLNIEHSAFKCCPGYFITQPHMNMKVHDRPENSITLQTLNLNFI